MNDTAPEYSGYPAMQVTEAGGPVVARRAPVVPPGRGEVRVTVHASGVCAADLGTVSAPSPAGGFPVTPGHEVAGVVDEVGAGVEGWQPGDRVAVGWFGGSCGHCAACRSGDVVHCPERRIPGLSYPGGWATSITVPAAAPARIPDGLGMAEAAPFGCAGVTTFNAVRHGRARPGDRVAVLGLGGLGHLAVQFAARMGYETVVVSRGAEKEADARSLGAHHYIDSSRDRPGAALRARGGAALIVSTASGTGLLAELVDGLAPHGHLSVVGFDAADVAIPMGKLVMGARTLSGHLTGSPVDTEAAMRFAMVTGVRPRVQALPLESAEEALAVLRRGEARYRTVLTTPHLRS
ncbi:alcohol dehydrogenase catalytic domain-containing protein [Streptomyces liangshanensis]|uniref:Alcohol dehydrogenase catalytic domain-containing protein n=1 Tax=Streptomyces liangshanensis TaxID=2717324 RepID=A0A6G9GW89_9ACTN|nr:alcohol dehydrogenase catalytic domain-containing protein [Streptomyces liangshanensis]QIQ02187.1 alcohol dehydrogenase catalytic domain-containing protein [Streptomyces liangshanensis]